MLTKDDIREVLKIYGSLYDMSEDVSLVVFCRENFEYSDLDYADVHIDIEFEYGDFLSIFHSNVSLKLYAPHSVALIVIFGIKFALDISVNKKR